MEDPPWSRSCLLLRTVSMERLSLHALVLTLVDVRILGVLLHALHETSTAAATVTTALLLGVVVALALGVVTTIHHLLTFLDDVVHVVEVGELGCL
jgi:hypothetical protein